MAKSTTVEAAIEIDRPVADTFSAILDVDRWREWQSRFIEVEQTSEGPHGLGTTIRTVAEALGRQHESRSEVTEFVKDGVVTYKGKSDTIAFEAKWTFSEIASGKTQVAVQMQSEPLEGPLIKLVHPWLSRVFRKRLEADLESFKIMLETDK